MGLAPNAPRVPHAFPYRSQNVPSAGNVVSSRAFVAAVTPSSHAGILRAEDISYVLPDGMITSFLSDLVSNLSTFPIIFKILFLEVWLQVVD